MSKNGIKELLKVIGVVLCAFAAMTLVLFFKFSSDRSVIRRASAYCKEFTKDGDKYKVTYTFNINGDEVTKEYVYDEEPFVGKTETVYYVKDKGVDIYDSESDVNLYKSYYGVLGVAGAFLFAALLAFAGSKSIRKRKNYRVTKKIKVDEASMYKGK